MKTESRFDTEAARWDDNPQRVALARAVGMGIRRVTGIKPGWRILDYGAGTGLMTILRCNSSLKTGGALVSGA